MYPTEPDDFDWSIYNEYLSETLKLSDEDIIKHIRSTKDGPFIRDGKLIKRELEVNDEVWTSVDPLLGTTSDEAIAKFFGIPDYYVRHRRECYSIPHIFELPVESWYVLVENGTNEEIREMFTNPPDYDFADELLDRVRERAKKRWAIATKLDES